LSYASRSEWTVRWRNPCTPRQENPFTDPSKIYHSATVYSKAAHAQKRRDSDTAKSRNLRICNAQVEFQESLERERHATADAALILRKHQQ